MFKDITKTIDKAKNTAYKRPNLCLDLEDFQHIQNIYGDYAGYDLIADVFCLGFLQGQKSAKGGKSA